MAYVSDYRLHLSGVLVMDVSRVIVVYNSTLFMLDNNLVKRNKYK